MASALTGSAFSVPSMSLKMTTPPEKVSLTTKGPSYLYENFPRESGMTALVSTPFWPTGFLHENPRPKPGLLFITRQSEANMRARRHELQKGSRVLQKAQRAIRRTNEQRTPKTAEAGTMALFITRLSERQKVSNMGL
ncbi:hypothetical protein CRG98_009160 [Punica granatum]|uniref:Uncharacterized protein n=1 Tax=Punica granatum TaxID=22663 RepID=A0A2I0KQ41_PUNGR|nr:hypothetical protein CRG98_009160 [Punica granatum]